MFLNPRMWCINTPTQEQRELLASEESVNDFLKYGYDSIYTNIVLVSDDPLVLKSGLDFLHYVIDEIIAYDKNGAFLKRHRDRKTFLENNKAAVDTFLRRSDVEERLRTLNSEHLKDEDYPTVWSDLVRMASEAVNEIL